MLVQTPPNILIDAQPATSSENISRNSLRVHNKAAPNMIAMSPSQVTFLGATGNLHQKLLLT